MRVVIIGGRALADCLIELLHREIGGIVVINDDFSFCEYLSNRHDVDIICGDGTQMSILEEAQIEEFDACIALTDDDADNLAICQLCSHFFGIEHQICTVSNPDNVDVFRRLGIEGAIGGMNLLAQAIGAITQETMQTPLFTDKIPAHARLDGQTESFGSKSLGIKPLQSLRRANKSR